MEPSTIWSETEYIHANPVRRGLWQRALGWVWSSAADYLAVREGSRVLETLDGDSIDAGLERPNNRSRS